MQSQVVSFTAEAAAEAEAAEAEAEAAAPETVAEAEAAEAPAEAAKENRRKTTQENHPICGGGKDLEGDPLTVWGL